MSNYFTGFCEGLCSALSFGTIKTLCFLMKNFIKGFNSIFYTNVYIITSVHIVSYLLNDVLTNFPGRPFFFFNRVCDRDDKCFFSCAQTQSS